jgi:hypothetical protein
LPWKRNTYYIFWVCSVSYPACESDVVYDIVICGQSGSTMCLPHYRTNRTIFRKETNLLNINLVFWLSLKRFSAIFLILRRIQRDIINVLRYSSKVPVIIVRFEWKGNFIDSFPKSFQIPNFMKILSVGAQIFHADWRTDMQTDMKKLIVACRYFLVTSLKLWVRRPGLGLNPFSSEYNGRWQQNNMYSYTHNNNKTNMYTTNYCAT